MQDHTIHGLLESNPPQTLCGKLPFGLKTSSDKSQMTCSKCRSVYEKVQKGGEKLENAKTRGRLKTSARY
jgi:hypothetical protein